MNALCMLYLVCLMLITCVLMVLYTCEWVFDVCNVCEHDYLLRVFEQGRLLVVRVGNLNKLTLRVFDPGRLLVVKVGNLNELS